MKLAIMTQPNFFIEEDKIIQAIFDIGLDFLHIHKPEAEPLYSERLLSLLSDDYYKRIIVHEHYYLKEEYGLGGIHIDDMTEEVPNGYKGKYSRTCTDFTLLKQMKKKCQYVLLGNTFATQDGSEAFSQSQLEQAAKAGLIDKHVYAYGGVNADNISAVRDLGFGGVVICDDLWSKFNIHNQRDFTMLLNHFERLVKEVKR